MANPLTVSGGAAHHAGALTHAEFQAAQHALSKISSNTGSLGSKLASLSQSATLIGGSGRASAPHTPSLLPGSGSDTFFGGARTSAAGRIGSDTIVGGSTKAVAGRLDVLGTHSISHFALSTDTINVAGATALSVKTLDPSESVKGHTLAVSDKTTLTINGLSAHDISKLSH
jgi:hypothetical protein